MDSGGGDGGDGDGDGDGNSAFFFLFFLSLSLRLISLKRSTASLQDSDGMWCRPHPLVHRGTVQFWRPPRCHFAQMRQKSALRLAAAGVVVDASLALLLLLLLLLLFCVCVLDTVMPDIVSKGKHLPL
jgi:hypothetical protein